MKAFNFEPLRNRASTLYNNLSSGFISRWAKPPTRNTAEWLDMFSKSPRLAVVDRIANDLANLSGKLLRIDKNGTEIEIAEHPFLQFIGQPNPLYEMTSAAIWRLHEIYLMLVGEGFLLIERDAYGQPTELWNVPPHWVKKTPYLGSPTYTILSPSGLSMTVPVEDMFVMKQLNPLDPFMRGLGMAESIADEVEIDEYAAKFQKRFFYNDATPPIIFAMPDATTEQRDAFMARWNQKQRGVENSHKAAAITGNIDVKVLGSNDPHELGFVESRIALRDAVLEHFSVPREIMGITENSNRATADAAQYIYAKNVLTPRLRMREEAINKQLLSWFDDGLVWRFDPIIPYDREFDKGKALEAYEAGLITKNEARELLDLPDIDGGDIYKISLNDLFLNATDDPTEVTQALTQEPEPTQNDPVFEDDETSLEAISASLESFLAGFSGKSVKRKVNVTALLREEDKAIRQNERRFQVAIAKHFLEQQKAIESVLGLTAKADDDLSVLISLSDYLLSDGTFNAELWAELSEEEQLRLTAAIADGLLDWDAEAQALLEALTPLWKKAYEDGLEISAEVYDLIALERPEFTSAAKVYGGQRVTHIEQTTKDSIAKVIARGVAEGLSQNSLKKLIMSEMDTTPTRAKLIARQETSTALAVGQFEMMSSAGAKTKTWHHRHQRNPRHWHIKLEGETVGINERFSNGLRYPRDPEDGRAEEVINCRCYLTYDGF